MKSLDKEFTEIIITAKNQGYSSRHIANVLGIGKSTVNDVYKREQDKPSKKPKIAFLDVETAAAVSYHFGRWNINIGEDSVLQQGGQVLVSCHSWLDTPEVEELHMTPKELQSLDDSRIIYKLYDLYEDADAIVMHNGKKFDHKVIQTRGTYFGYGRLPTVKILDTLEIAKQKLRLPSNKLDSIGNYFNLGRKIDTGGIELWKKVQQGDKQAMQDMVTYCQQDVNLLKSVFHKLVHLGIPGFNAGLYFDDEQFHCTACGSTHVYPTGRFTYSAVNKFTEYQCMDCGSVSKDRQALTTKEKRKALLSN